jgi:hypothetical protein
MNQVVSTVRERATAQLDAQKGRATEGLDAIAHAVRQTTQQLRNEQQGTLADYIEKVADQLERVSGGIRDKNVNELMRDAQQLARRQPALFIGGSFAAGLLLARFLKSSRRNDTWDDSSWDDRDDSTWEDEGGRAPFRPAVGDIAASPWTEPIGRERF